jgi:hypothetical protein
MNARASLIDFKNTALDGLPTDNGTIEFSNFCDCTLWL